MLTLQEYTQRLHPHNPNKTTHNQELDNILTLPYLTKHRPGSKSYKRAAAVLHALRCGVANTETLTTDQINASITRTSKKLNLDPANVAEFFHKKFSRAERQELMQRLSDNFRPDFNGWQEGPRDIYAALCTPFTGFSLLCKVWLLPPGKKILNQPKVLTPVIHEKLKKGVEVITEICRLSTATPDVMRIIKALHRRWAKKFTHLNTVTDDCFPFPAFVRALANEVVVTEPSPQPRHFSPAAPNYPAFENYHIDEMVAVRETRAWLEREKTAKEQAYESELQEEWALDNGSYWRAQV